MPKDYFKEMIGGYFYDKESYFEKIKEKYNDACQRNDDYEDRLVYDRGCCRIDL